MAAYIEAPYSPPTVKVWWVICFSRQTVSPRYLPNGSTVVRWWYDDTQRTCVLGTTEKFVFLLSCGSSQKLLQRMEGGANRTRSFWALKFTFAKIPCAGSDLGTQEDTMRYETISGINFQAEWRHYRIAQRGPGLIAIYVASWGKDLYASW